jgi:hypothetical protein
VVTGAPSSYYRAVTARLLRHYAPPTEREGLAEALLAAADIVQRQFQTAHPQRGLYVLEDSEPLAVAHRELARADRLLRAARRRA